MAVKDKILNNYLQKFNNALNCSSVAKTDTPHMLVGVQDGPSPMEKV